MSDVKHFVGNLSPALYYLVRMPIDGATNPADPSQQEPFPFPAGTTVRFYMRRLADDVLRVDAPAVIVNPSATLPADADAGRLRYDWQSADVAEPGGEYVAWFRVTFPGGATQDVPSFTVELAEHFDASPDGAYTSVGKLKDFTGLTALKSASDEWLATNVIPRAEAWLGAFGPFTTPTCPQLALAANMLAEAIFERVDPTVRNRRGIEGVKSESIGDYSYTLSDVVTSSEGSTPWDQLMAEVGMVVAPCVVAGVGGTGEVLYGSEGDVFQRLLTDTYDPRTGELTAEFLVASEISVLQNMWVWR